MSNENITIDIISFSKKITTIIGAISLLVAGYISLDSRYAKTEDVKELKHNVEKEFKNIKIMELTNMIFMLKVRIEEKRATSVDIALYEKLKRDLENINDDN